MSQIRIDKIKETFEKVCVRHYVESKVTVAALINGNQVFFGIAKCHPSDQFVKKTGYVKAIGRAISAYVRYLKNGDDGNAHDNDNSYRISTVDGEDLKALVTKTVYKRDEICQITEG